uniref:Uncharacterized protein n=1 Tax=Anopheles darlingi TaxID=43151 RepID=A0A2M4DCD4_ANODA
MKNAQGLFGCAVILVSGTVCRFEMTLTLLSGFRSFVCGLHNGNKSMVQITDISIYLYALCLMMYIYKHILRVLTLPGQL